MVVLKGNRFRKWVNDGYVALSWGNSSNIKCFTNRFALSRRYNPSKVLTKPFHQCSFAYNFCQPNSRLFFACPLSYVVPTAAMFCGWHNLDLLLSSMWAVLGCGSGTCNFGHCILSVFHGYSTDQNTLSYACFHWLMVFTGELFAWLGRRSTTVDPKHKSPHGRFPHPQAFSVGYRSINPPAKGVPYVPSLHSSFESFLPCSAPYDSSLHSDFRPTSYSPLHRTKQHHRQWWEEVQTF